MVKRPFWRPIRFALIALALCAAGGSASAYWAPNHMEINEQVAREGKPFNFSRGGKNIQNVNDYIQRVFLLSGGERKIKAVGFRRASTIGFDVGDRPSDSPDTQLSLFDWNKKGGLWEDGFLDMSEGTKWGGYRAVNHFHDPIAVVGNGGYHGFIDTTSGKTVPYLNLMRSGISAYEWANGGANGSEISNWDLHSAEDGFWQYLTESDPKDREKGIGNAFRATGQVEHLIEDNTVPDHARDLPHPGDGFEEYMQNHRQSMFGKLRPQSSWMTLPLTTIESKGFRAYWDGDVYTGLNPHSVAPGSGAGIAEMTNANFFAWNSFTKSFLLDQEIWFSRIPDEAHAPYKNDDDKVYYPFPLVDQQVDSQSAQPTYWTVTSDTFPANPGVYGKTTHYPFQTPVWILDGSVWFHYADPLMRLAHGYAQSLLTMVMPPVDAEIIPDPSDPLRKVVVRVWNLGGDAQLGNGVTWHIKKVQLKPIQPEKPVIDPPGLTNDPSPIDVTFSSADIPADGNPHASDPLTLSYSQRYTILYSSHVAVAIEAELGTEHPVTLKFGTVIPNSFVDAEQQTATTMTSTLEPYQDECDVACSAKWTRAAGGQWTHQQVQGSVQLLASKLDPLGQRADTNLQKVQQDLTHLAGMALIATDNPTGIDSWRFPSGVTLTVNGSQLEKSSASPLLWLRPESADRNAVESTPATFNIDIQLDQASNIQPVTSLIANQLYLVAWSTSGSMTFQKLALWMPPVGLTASQLYAQSGSCPKGGLMNGVTSATWSVCAWGGPDSPNPTCDGKSGLITGRSIQMNTPWLPTPTLDPSAAIFYNSQFPTMKPLELSGHSVPLMMNTDIPQNCPATLFSTGSEPCSLSNTTIYVEINIAEGGPCPGAIAAKPALPASARLQVDYQRVQYRVYKSLGQTLPTVFVNLQ